MARDARSIAEIEVDRALAPEADLVEEAAEIGELQAAEHQSTEGAVRLVDAPAEVDHALAGQTRDDRLADEEAEMPVGFVRLEVVAVGEVPFARWDVSGVLDDVAVLVKDEHHAEVPRGGGAVEQDELAHGRVELCQAGSPQVVLYRLEREVDDLDVAGDGALDDLKQVLRGLLGLVPGVLAQIQEHQPGHEQHSDGCEDAHADPGVGGAEPSREAGRQDHRPVLPGASRCLVSPT
jgi:hypothetical protein